MANQILPITGIHHVALGVSDLERSLHFYVDGLGFRKVRTWRSGDGKRTLAMIDVGNGDCFEVFSDCEGKLDSDKIAGQFFHLALRVSDSAACFRRALEFGATPKMEPKAMELPSDPPLPAVISFVYGPDGEQVEFFEEH